MANGYFPRERDKLQEIERRLHECHLTYLEINESPEKLKQRNKLEGKTMSNLKIHKKVFQ